MYSALAFMSSGVTITTKRIARSETDYSKVIRLSLVAFKYEFQSNNDAIDFVTVVEHFVRPAPNGPNAFDGCDTIVGN